MTKIDRQLLSKNIEEFIRHTGLVHWDYFWEAKTVCPRSGSLTAIPMIVQIIISLAHSPFAAHSFTTFGVIFAIVGISLALCSAVQTIGVTITYQFFTTFSVVFANFIHFLALLLGWSWGSSCS